MNFSRGNLVFLAFIHIAFGANIIAFQGALMKSHFQIFNAVLQILAQFHNITFYVPSELNYNKNCTNITTINYITGALTPREAVKAMRLLDDPCKIDSFYLFYDKGLHENISLFETIYSDKNIQKLITSKDKYDLLIMNGYFTEQFFPFAYIFDAPVILISPSTLFPWVNDAINNSPYWDSDASFIVPDRSDTFLGRIKKYIKNILLLRKFYNKMSSAMDKAAEKYFPSGTSSVKNLMKRTELVFLNTHNAMGFPRLSAPSVLQIGGIHVSNSTPLSSELEEFLSDSDEDGFIYFSMGSFIPDSAFNDNVKSVFFNTFQKLNQKVLWKWDGEYENISTNIKISKWYNQQDILRHKNIKLFITQGGMLSLIEASYFGVPVLAIPILFDQIPNVEFIEKIGYGLSLNFCNISENLLHQTILELITNPKYSQTAKQISNIILNDIPKMQQDIRFWVDFVIQNKNSSILHSATAKKSRIQTLPADILLTLIIFIICVCIILFYVVLGLISILSNFQAKNKHKIE